MINISIFIIAILILSSAVKFLFKYSIEASLMITICSITILIALASLVGILQFGIYLVYLIIIASLVYLIIYSIKNRKQMMKTLPVIFTPGVVMMLLAYFIYYMLIKDKVMIHDDEAGSWASQVKYMYMTNVYKDYSGHNHILGFFTLFFLKITGYSEPIFFLSLWTIIWSSFVLIMKNIKWKQWYKALIFAIGGYCIINMIGDVPSYYMDAVQGVIAGVICVSWSMKEVKRKDYLWLYLGLIILVNIKDELGSVLALLISLYCISCNFIRGSMLPDKEHKMKVVDKLLNIGLLLIVLVFPLSSASMANIFKNIAGALGTIYSVIVIVLLFALIGMIIIFRKKISKMLSKNYKLSIIIGAISIIFIGLVAFIIVYSKIPIDSFRRIELLIFRLWSENVFGRPAYMIIILSIIFTILSSLLLMKKEYSTSFLIQSCLIILMIVIYGTALLFGYMITTSEYFDHFMKSFTRYYIPIFMLASIWFSGKMIRFDIEYKNKMGFLITSLILVSLFITKLPVIGKTALANLEPIRYTFTYQLRPDLKKQADFIRENVDDDRILIVCATEPISWDPFTAGLWLGYELIPMQTDRVILLGGEEYIHTRINNSFTSDELKEYIAGKDCNFVYFYTKNQFMDEEYSDLMDKSDSDLGILYKVTPEAEHFLTLIDSYK